MDTNIRYPRLERRIQAAVIDSVILTFAFLISASIISSTDLNVYARIGFVAMFIFISEPALVSFGGATIGHRLRGLRIVGMQTGENIGVVRAIVRFLVKYFFGLFSLAFILITKRHQAIHDLASQTIVIFADGTKVDALEKLEERKSEEVGYTYPSTLRRTLVIIAYLVCSVLILAFGEEIFLSSECVNKLRLDSFAQCAGTDGEIQRITNFSVLTVWAAVLVLGWRGRLWGCRRTKVDSLDAV